MNCLCLILKGVYLWRNELPFINVERARVFLLPFFLEVGPDILQFAKHAKRVRTSSDGSYIWHKTYLYNVRMIRMERIVQLHMLVLHINHARRPMVSIHVDGEDNEVEFEEIILNVHTNSLVEIFRAISRQHLVVRKLTFFDQDLTAAYPLFDANFW